MLEFLNGGLQTTIQDGGRYGYQASGVPVCGAMDQYALAQANILCGNAWYEAALEFCALGPTIRFHESNIFCICGGRFDVKLNGTVIECGHAYLASSGSVLSIGSARHGFRGILAVAGGFLVNPVMGSCSTCLAAHFGGYDGRIIRSGDCIQFRAPQLWLRGLPQRVLTPPETEDLPVRVVVGAQYDVLTSASLQHFFHSEYKVSEKSNRMGIRLEGPALTFQPNLDANIISDGVALGAIQIPNGQPIVMMADRQTVGGYAKIGAVCSVDLPIMAQKRPGSSVRFMPITVQEAQRLIRVQTRNLQAAEAELNRGELW